MSLSVTKEPKPGDLIEIFRFGYQHWAIYVGNGYVIHLAPPSECADAGSSSVMSVLTEWAVVRKDPLSVVLGSSSYKVNNKYDKEYTPYPVSKILQRAEKMVGQRRRYSVTSKNCEHFVTELRYDQAKCEQVENAIRYTGWAAATGFAVLAAFGIVMSRNKQQKQ
ncbi:phospholipase A and acyltransferase 3 [Microcaecilia unicolor]|uniref:Phospholipase A and acyltransferase 3-like n=1 Tax=Microcaecilia unicolor TaxID=1415580 RepID=A0A6P7Z518_9AMPH|nr:phospholipase A and acyltransferase 3-like [Microcaecilia unicolor]